MSSNDKSCANKQRNVHFKSYFVFFPVQTVSTEVYLTATIQENCSRRSEVAAKFPEMVR